MLASEVYSFLKCHINDQAATVDVTSIDKLPKRYNLPLYLVVNLDDSSEPGSHWTSVFIDEKKRGIYFDSFGQYPPAEIENFLKMMTDSFEFSNVQIQAFDSTSCGLFSSIALINFSRNKTLKDFLSNFARFNTFLNELIIKNMSENNCMNKYNK